MRGFMITPLFFSSQVIVKAHSPSAGLSSGIDPWSPPTATGTWDIITRNHD